jgi:hypothetical protein
MRLNGISALIRRLFNSEDDNECMKLWMLPWTSEGMKAVDVMG